MDQVLSESKGKKDEDESHDLDAHIELLAS